MVGTRTWRSAWPPEEAISYLKAEDELDRSSSGEDAVVRVADEEEVQDSQQEHQGCGKRGRKSRWRDPKGRR